MEVTMVSLGNVLIFGDSYSTFFDYIPQENAYYYGDGRTETDLRFVEQTWWHQVITKTNSNLILNDSWAGSTICNTGYSGPNSPISFINRFDRLSQKGFFEENRIDTVLVMGGQNDDWCGAQIGKLKTKDWQSEDLLQYAPATCFLMYRIKEDLPNARIVFVVNSNMKKEIMELQEEAANIYGVDCIRLQNICKVQGHPNIEGMKQISRQILEKI